MDPETLTKYLKALKAENVASARLVFPYTSLVGGKLSEDKVEINVIFTPEMDALPGEVPQAGGWKGPEKLDDHSTFDLPREEPKP